MIMAMVILVMMTIIIMMGWQNYNGDNAGLTVHQVVQIVECEWQTKMYRCTAKAGKWDIRVYDIIIRIVITTGSSRKDDKLKRFSWALKFTMNGLLSFFSCPGQLNNWHCLSVGRSEPTNNQSREIRIAMETNTTVVKVRNTLDKTWAITTITTITTITAITIIITETAI